MKYKNNPFNIRKGTSKWLGSISEPGASFESFDTLEHGIRAFFIIMRTYAIKYGRTSVRSIVTRFAPPFENNIERYIKYVSLSLGVSPDLPLSTQTQYINLAQCMASFESATYIPLPNLYYIWHYYHIATSKFPVTHALPQTSSNSEPAKND